MKKSPRTQTTIEQRRKKILQRKKPVNLNVDPNTVINSLPNHIYWKDKDGVLAGNNEQHAKSFGFASTDAPIGLDDFDLGEILGMEKDLIDKVRHTDQEIMQSKIPQTTEEIYNNSDGEPRVYLSQKIPLLDDKNEVIGILGVSSDITERKKLENDLAQAKIENEELAKRSNTYLQNILKNLPEPVYWQNKEGIILGCNDKEAVILGMRKAEDLIGCSLQDLANSLDWNKKIAEDLFANNKEIMATGIGRSYDEDIIGPNGDKRYYISHKAPLYDEKGQAIGIIGTSVDITERKRLESELRIAKERAEASSKAKSQFLAITSHELRTPLSGIMGMLQLLTNDNSLNEEQAEYVHHGMAAAQHLLSLVNDILDFSKIEAGKYELHPTPIDLKDLVEEISMMFTAQAKLKNIEILTSYGPTVPHLVIADSRALRQVLINLMGNAIKFTETGFVSLSVRTLQQKKHDALLELAVTDSGIGIPNDQYETIFELFEQVDSSYTRRHGGTGLGLAITKNLLKLMNGDIKVSSELGKGSTFHCVVPFPLQEQVISQAPWELYESKVRVLIVDDTTRGEVLRRQISLTNCDVTTGQNTLNTLISAQQLNKPYHVVIIDQQVTSTDAFQLASDIKKRRGLLKPMLLLLSKEQSINHYRDACAAGFYDCLTKPMQPTVLQSTLTAAWEKWIEKEGDI